MKLISGAIQLGIFVIGLFTVGKTVYTWQQKAQDYDRSAV